MRLEGMVGERLAAAAWVGILLAVCGRVLLSDRSPSVYPLYAQAARHWIEGAAVYDHLSGEPYRYSPLATLVLIPFGLMPDRVGSISWRLLNAGVFLAGLGFWMKAVLPRTLTKAQGASLYYLVIPLSVGSLNNAQSNLLVIGLLLAGTAAVARQHWNLAAASLAVAGLFKLYPLAVGLLLAAAYPRRLAGRLTLFLLLGLIVPFVMQRPGYVADQYLRWLHLLQNDNRQDWPLNEAYRDLRLLCRVWLQPLSSSAYLAIQVLSGCAIAAWCLTRRRALGSSFLATILALGCCWMTVCGFATESCTYALLAPALAWAVLEAWLEPSVVVRRLLLTTSYSLFLVTQLAIALPGGRRLGNWGPQPLAALLLFGCLIAGSWSHLDLADQAIGSADRDHVGPDRWVDSGRAA
jgi:hypothetical protein